MDKTSSSRRSFLAIVVASAIGATIGFASTSAIAAPEPRSTVAVADQSECTNDPSVDESESRQVPPRSTTTITHRGGHYAPTPQ
ncbi:hypothetical protein [Microbacterium sp. P5_E9]